MDRHTFMQACRDGGAHINAVLTGLYRDYRRALVNDGYASLGDEGMANDLLQDTLLNAWRKCGSYRGDSELFPWLRQIYRRKLVDMLRRLKPEVPLDAGDKPGDWPADIEAALRAWRGNVDAAPGEALADREAEACFRACAARFSADHPLPATVVGWMAQDELDVAQIAALLGRTPAATREYMSQCRQKARVYFADWYALLRRPGGAAATGGKP